MPWIALRLRDVGYAVWELRLTSLLAKSLGEDLIGLWHSVRVGRSIADAVILTRGGAVLVIEVKHPRSNLEGVLDTAVRQRNELDEVLRVVSDPSVRRVFTAILLRSDDPRAIQGWEAIEHRGVEILLLGPDDKDAMAGLLIRLQELERQIGPADQTWIGRVQRSLERLSTTPRPGSPLILRGDDAREWYRTARGGPTLMDVHLVALAESFGDRRFELVAFLHPESLEPTRLLVEIESDLSDEDWVALVRFQGLLLAQEDHLSETLGLRHPFQRIDTTLVPSAPAARESADRRGL
jgi:hypothetical protein